MDFKWKLSRPGIELEFETGSIKEAIGLLEEEGTQISEVFGFTMGTTNPAPVGAAEPEKPARKPRTPKVDAIAPPPLPVPAAPVAPPPVTTVLPPNTLQGEGGIPPFLDRKNPEAAVHSAPPVLPSPPTVPASPPPVGVLGPKVVAALEAHKTGEPDGDQKLADWLAACGLTIPGKTFDEACRVVLMTSDEKLKPIAEAFGVPA